MAKQISFGSMFVGSTTSPSPATTERSDDQPFRILVIGDFSGEGSSQNETPAGPLKRPIAVDRDNLEELFQKMRPTVNLPGMHPDGSAIRLELKEWDDLHPDHLYEQLPLFETLRVTRNRLKNPKTFAAAAEEVQKWAAEKSQADKGSGDTGTGDEGTGKGGRESGSPSAADAAPASGGEWLDQLLGQDDDDRSGGLPSSRPTVQRRPDAFQQLLAKIVEPHRLAAADPRLGELVDAVDELAADRMRAILHHPNFQAVESAWRSIEMLTRRLETGRELKIYLLDCSKAALGSELANVEQINRSAFFKTLTDIPPGAAPWTLLLGNYQFGANEPDVLMLGAIAQIAARAGAPFLAGANPSVFGADALADTPDPDDWGKPAPAAAQLWDALRQFPEATSLGLVAPRFLLRMPYGRNTSPVERFDFEEQPQPDHDGYLWGNSAFVVACLLGQTFSETGWNLGGRLYRDLNDLPAHIYEDDGESRVKPCAEILLIDRGVDRITDYGVMALQSFQDRGSVRLPRLQSLAEPMAALAGRWK